MAEPYLKILDCPTSRVPPQTNHFVLRVESNQHWKVVHHSTWVTIRPTEYYGSAKVFVNVEANLTDEARVGLIVIRYGDVSRTCGFMQNSLVVYGGNAFVPGASESFGWRLQTVYRNIMKHFGVTYEEAVSAVAKNYRVKTVQEDEGYMCYLIGVSIYELKI